jgi:hypothetical protein
MKQEPVRKALTAREWGFEGAAGRVVISDARSHGERVTADVVVEMRARGVFTGRCTVGFAADELARFHRQLGAMLTGGTRHATFGDVGDEVALTIDAAEDGRTSVTGFVGAGMTTAVSFNDLEIDRGSLVRSYLVLDLICREVGAVAVACGPGAKQQPPAAAPPGA